MRPTETDSGSTPASSSSTSTTTTLSLAITLGTPPVADAEATAVGMRRQGQPVEGGGAAWVEAINETEMLFGPRDHLGWLVELLGLGMLMMMV